MQPDGPGQPRPLPDQAPLVIGGRIDILRMPLFCLDPRAIEDVPSWRYGFRADPNGRFTIVQQEQMPGRRVFHEQSTARSVSYGCNAQATLRGLWHGNRWVATAKNLAKRQKIGSQAEPSQIRIHALVRCLLRGTLAAHPQLFCLRGVGRALFWCHSGNVHRMAFPSVLCDEDVRVTQ